MEQEKLSIHFGLSKNNLEGLRTGSKCWKFCY